MVTRKDIAQEAGVSVGTVSNVLNRRSNVSVEKIRLVEAACLKLGYAVNDNARTLRKGKSNTLSVILPNIFFPQYMQFYSSFKNYAENNNYRTQLYITDDNANLELDIINRLRSAMVAGVATISSLDNASQFYSRAGLKKNEVLFVERSFDTDNHYMGFDYAKAGHYFGTQAAQSKYSHLAVITGLFSHSNEQAFYQSFVNALRDDQKENLCSIQTNYPRRHHQILQALNNFTPEAFYLSNFSYVETLQKILSNFFSRDTAAIHTVSPLFSMPESRYEKYELNYAALGQKAAKSLIGSISEGAAPKSTILPADGYRNWNPPARSDSEQADCLNLLLMDGSESLAIQSMASLYTQKTGTRISCTLRTYDEIYDMLSKPDSLRKYDIVRLDVIFLSWFAERILRPLEGLDPTVEQILQQYEPGIAENYARCNGHIYALPFSPSVQMLYYRKDLFEDTMLRRMYREQHEAELAPPVTFHDFHQIAAFFTKANNPDSPVTYGTSLTIGTKSVAASEFMARYRAFSVRLHNASGELDINTEIAREVLEQLITLKPCTSPHTHNWWAETAAGFAAGENAMAIFYSNHGRALMMPNSKVNGKIGVSLVPGSNPLIGGGSLGILQESAHPHEALRFLRWLCSEPVSSATALLNGVVTCNSTYSNVEIQNTYPWLGGVRKGFSNVTDLRPPIQYAAPFNERQFLDIIGAATRATFNGELSPGQAVSQMQSYIKQMNP